MTEQCTARRQSWLNCFRLPRRQPDPPGQNCLVPFLHGMATLIGRSSKNPLQLIKRNLYRRRTIHVNSCQFMSLELFKVLDSPRVWFSHPRRTSHVKSCFQRCEGVMTTHDLSRTPTCHRCSERPWLEVSRRIRLIDSDDCWFNVKLYT